ncbi:MAG: hypothetical protein JSR18_14040 [Proteobacteria bacterium]|nr:hypothetical protein [Pseudomonadota bacterium]
MTRSNRWKHALAAGAAGAIVGAASVAALAQTTAPATTTKPASAAKTPAPPASATTPASPSGATAPAAETPRAKSGKRGKAARDAAAKKSGTPPASASFTPERFPKAPTEAAVREQVTELSKRLALTPEQTAKITPALEARGRELRAIETKYSAPDMAGHEAERKKETAAVNAKAGEAIKPVLNEEQWQRYSHERQPGRERYRADVDRRLQASRDAEAAKRPPSAPGATATPAPATGAAPTAAPAKN